MMKKILFIFLLSFSFLTTVFAETQLEISSDIQSLNLGNNFTFTVSILTDSQQEVKIKSISGLENFNTQSQANFRNIRIINGKTEIQSKIQYVLSPKKEGNFILGPVVVESVDGEVTSNTLSLTVGVKKQEQVSLEEINGNENIVYSWKDFLYYPSLLAVVVLFIVSIFYFFRETKSKPVVEEEVDMEEEDSLELFLHELKQLERQIEEISKNEFYTQFNAIFRNYFQFLGVDDADKKTLIEIKKEDLNKEIVSLFEQTYKSQFSNIEDTLEQRSSYIEALRDIIKK